MLGIYFPNFVKRRVKKRIQAKIIQQESPLMIKSRKKDKEQLREMRFSPVTFKSSVFIYRDKIALMTLTENILLGVIIKNMEIAETQKQVFSLLWELSK
jgi:nucleosome binding factor SPN SPT16 subunit